MNLTGAYSRWDLLSLNVRQEDYEPLVSMGTNMPETALPVSDQIAALNSRIDNLEQLIRSRMVKKGSNVDAEG